MRFWRACQAWASAKHSLLRHRTSVADVVVVAPRFIVGVPVAFCWRTTMVQSELSGSEQQREQETGGREDWLHMYEQMLKIRVFEENVNELYTTGKMPGLAHLYTGEEAIAVGVCEALRQNDYITSTHRGHGHCLAKGAAVDRMYAELLGKEPGYCK